MSLRGKIGCESAGAIGGFEAAAANLKESIGKFLGTSFGSDQGNPFGDLYLEGIVQGEIKLQATNDWKTTTYYGITDALGGLRGSAENAMVGGFSVNGSSVLKFANTVMNVFGYTLGGTGPASKRMYGGSNLNGLNVQFKWYTPYMSGWKEALYALCYLAWPTSAFNSDDNANAAAKQQAQSDAQKAAVEEEYKNIIKTCLAHANKGATIQIKINKILEALNNSNVDEARRLGNEIPDSQGFEDLNQIVSDLKVRLASPSPSESLIESLAEDAEKSSDLSLYVSQQAKARVDMQLRAISIGSAMGTTTQWYDLPAATLPVDSRSIAQPPLQGEGIPPTPTKEPASTGEFGLTDSIGLLKDASVDLIKGFKDSFARNPPKVYLEIRDSNDQLKYRFSPLVVTSFGITASRETVEGDPVILTIDVSFDYFQVNATNAEQAPLQKFAGVQIFNNKAIR